MEEQLTEFLSEDRADQLHHNTCNVDDLSIIVDYILMDLKKSTMNGKVCFVNQNNDKLSSKECLKHRYIFVFIPGDKLVKDTQKEREVKYVYQPREQVTVEKYRNKRKTEQAVISIKQMQIVMSNFQDTVGALLQSGANLQKSSQSFVAQLLPEDELNKRSKVAVKGGQMAYVQVERKNRPAFRNYTAEEVSQHNQPHDAWTVLNGKVYDITLYMEYHPGGREKLMYGAGRDCTKLFNQFHAWVNGHAFLEKDYIGNLKM